MNIELVGLAYERGAADAVWSGLPVRAAYDRVLADEFRRKVDLRSLLYHKGQMELLKELDALLRRGGQDLSILGLLAARFSAGVEDFPTPLGDLSLDFKLIRYFTSLAMVDDFLVADRFLRSLLEKVGFLKAGAHWTLLEVRDFDGVGSALRDVRMQDILDVAGATPSPNGTVSYENLVRNYIEFLSYARNNGLVPFFYNSHSDHHHWGDLIERKNRRSETVVELSMRPAKKSPRGETKTSVVKAAPDLRGKLRRQRDGDALRQGLSDPDPLIRQKSAESLGRLGDSGSVPELIQALPDREPEVRQEVVRALAVSDDPAAVEALLKVVQKEEVPAVALSAAYGLRELGVSEVIPLLLDRLEGGGSSFATVLAYHPKLASDRVAMRRLPLIARGENVEARREAAFVLGRVKGGEEHLPKLANDDDPEVVANALYSLWERKSEELPRILGKVSDSTPLLAQTKSLLTHWTA